MPVIFSDHRSGQLCSQCQLPIQETNDLERRFADIISNLVISFQNEVRVGKKIYDSQRAKMYGPYDKWHMIDCFVKVRDVITL